MNEKLARGVWLIIVVLFIGMEIYHLSVGNYNDFIISVLIVLIPLLTLAMYYLIRKQDKK